LHLPVLTESIPARATALHPRNTEASILVRRDGSYLLAWTEFQGEGRDDSCAVIAGLVSRDGGRTWGEKRMLQENIGGCNVMSAALLRLDDGTVLLGFIRKDSHTSCSLFVRSSRDDGETFGPAIQVNTWKAYMGFVNDSLVQTRNGRVICPAYFSAAGCWNPDEHYVARMCLSDDRGRTWRAAHDDVDCPLRGAMEPIVIERADQTLLMLIRTQTGWVYRSESRDGGESWTPPVPSVLPGQEAPIMARYVPGTAALILVWNAAYDPNAPSHGGRRSVLHIAVSRDDLESMPTPLVLEHSDTATFSYPSIAFDGDRLLLTYYVGEDHALVGGARETRLSLKFRALDLPALLQQAELS